MQRFHKKNIRWTLFALGMYALLFVLVQTGVINFYYESTFINIMINIIYAVGLNLILGVAGQFSLGMPDLSRLVLIAVRFLEK